MIPCRFCGAFTEDGGLRPGLKQVGKPKRRGDEPERVYQCQECGASLTMSGQVNTPITADQWTPPTTDVGIRKN
jgi:hypothetical protein